MAESPFLFLGVCGTTGALVQSESEILFFSPSFEVAPFQNRKFSAAFKVGPVVTRAQIDSSSKLRLSLGSKAGTAAIGADLVRSRGVAALFCL